MAAMFVPTELSWLRRWSSATVPSKHFLGTLERRYSLRKRLLSTELVKRVLRVLQVCP